MARPSIKLWPNPSDGRKYGPTAKQKLLFIEHLPDVDTWVDIHTGDPVEPNSPSSINIKRPSLSPFGRCSVHWGCSVVVKQLLELLVQLSS